MDYKTLKSSPQLAAYLSFLEEQKITVIALDIEAELNQHAYGETLCLIQVYDGLKGVLIDPLNIDSLLLKAFFENRNLLKVIYDAGSDLSFLKNAYNIEIKSILDLRPAVSLLNLEKQDLHSVIGSELGVILEHKARFQRYNWLQRPLSTEAIEYALNDVLYLLKLKDILLKKLFEKQLMDTFILSNLKVQNKDYTRNPEDKFNRLVWYQKLEDKDKLIIQEINKVIEKYACLHNIPAGWIINKKEIVEILKDPDFLNNLRLPTRFSQNSRRNILAELRLAARL